MFSLRWLLCLLICIASYQQIRANPLLEFGCYLSEVARVGKDSFKVEVASLPGMQTLDSVVLYTKGDSIRFGCPMSNYEARTDSFLVVAIGNFASNDTITFLNTFSQMRRSYVFHDSLEIGQSWELKTMDEVFNKAFSSLGKVNFKGFGWMGRLLWLPPTTKDSTLLTNFHVATRFVSSFTQCSHVTGDLYTDSIGRFRIGLDKYDAVGSVYVDTPTTTGCWRQFPSLPTQLVTFSRSVVFGDSMEADLLILSDRDPRQPPTFIQNEESKSRIYRIALKGNRIQISVPTKIPFALMPLTLDLYDVHGGILKSYAIRAGFTDVPAPARVHIAVLRINGRILHRTSLLK
jgi:hypothetical protein